MLAVQPAVKGTSSMGTTTLGKVFWLLCTLQEWKMTKKLEFMLIDPKTFHVTGQGFNELFKWSNLK